MLTDVQPKPAVAAALARLSNLAMLPETAMRVLRLADDPDVTMSSLADVISTSPELSARILRVVNSAFYGFPGEIRSIERATTLMGLESVRNVTIAASLTRVFQGRPLSSRFSPRDLWVHSLSVASAARLVCVATKPGVADEAFLAGLLHDIGLMVELQVSRLKLTSVLAAIEAGSSDDVLALEEAAFGATHQDFGSGLLRAWRLPVTFALAAGRHHDPFALPDRDRLLPLMVHAADRLVAACAGPFPLDDPSPDVGDAVLDLLRLTRDQVNQVLTGLPAAVEEAQSIFGAR